MVGTQASDVMFVGNESLEESCDWVYLNEVEETPKGIKCSTLVIGQLGWAAASPFYQGCSQATRRRTMPRHQGPLGTLGKAG